MTNAEAAVEAVAPEPIALRALDRLAEAIVIGALLGELLLVLANVVARVFFGQSFLWSDEVARLVLSILAFVGGAVAYRRRDHAQVRLLLNLIPSGAERACLVLADVIVFFVSALIGVASIAFIVASWAERTPILQAPAALIALPLPIGMALMGLYAAVQLWREHGRMALIVAAFFLAAIALLATTCGSWLPALGDDAPLIAALALFFVAIFAGVPVGFVLLLASASYLWMSNAGPLIVLPQTMAAGAGNYILLAIPFFILAGLVMERGGISARLIRFVHALVGHMRGGLLHVAVVSMYVISGLSGSKPADVAAVGTIMRDEVRARHGAPEGAAVLAVSAIMGETVPPSIAMLIVGSITNVSVAGMFIGGLMPAAVIAFCLMALIAIRARFAGAPPAPRAPVGEVARAGVGAILPLLMPGMLLAGILFGLATPTEVAALAVVYGAILAVFVYREMTVAGFLRAVQNTAALTGVLLFIFTAASAFSWVLTIAYLPQRLVDLLAAGHANAAVFMIGSIALLIFVGVLLEGLPSLNVLAPLLLPIAVKLGFSGLHFAIVLIIAMGVGGFMPLAGVGFYVCCAVMRCDIEPASRAMLPYLAVVVAGLLVVAFVPWFALALPNHFGFRG
jgi:tripartite ATP-independent transporter DctM subunit